jgi:hypothetical protein
MKILKGARRRTVTALGAALLALLATLVVASPAAAAGTPVASGGGCRPSYTNPDANGIRIEPCIGYLGYVQNVPNYSWIIGENLTVKATGSITPSSWVCEVRVSVNGGAYVDALGVDCSPNTSQPIKYSVGLVAGNTARWVVEVGYWYHGIRYDYVDSAVLTTSA